VKPQNTHVAHLFTEASAVYLVRRPPWYLHPIRPCVSFEFIMLGYRFAKRQRELFNSNDFSHLLLAVICFELLVSMAILLSSSIAIILSVSLLLGAIERPIVFQKWWMSAMLFLCMFSHIFPDMCGLET
jgi:hypothetical protein